jgi:hydrogenase maturation protein HypF
VRRLRALKQRDAKPFAVMCPTIESARRLVDLSDQAAALMRSPACPIVLAPRLAGAPVATCVAPGTHRLGVMLPYTPIQHLLFEGGELGSLVMTSGNVSDEPLVIDNDEALRRLGGLCDALLWHNRPIQRPVDDSVLIDMGNRQPPLPVRRARGYVPAGISIDAPGQSRGLSLGAELKNTVGVLRDGRVVLSHHLGDLVDPQAFAYFREAADDLCELTGTRPQWIAHDLHPMYLSTRYARELSGRWKVRRIGVQHHHAHAAAVMAEHRVAGPVLAVVCDGVGYGTDQTAWGGELLVCQYARYERVARLRPMLLPGGDAAARQTWRCGLSLLGQAVGGDLEEHPLARRLAPDAQSRQMICQMLTTGTACVPSSGAGRLFDGVAAMLGLCVHNDFEAQAPMALEAAADQHEAPECAQPLFVLNRGALCELDLSPLVREIARRAMAGDEVGEIAALLHDQFAAAWEAAVVETARTTGLSCVALSGGVFCNERLIRSLTDRLVRRGLTVLRHRIVPPNDGGIALGQAAIAAAVYASQTGGA